MLALAQLAESVIAWHRCPISTPFVRESHLQKTVKWDFSQSDKSPGLPYWGWQRANPSLRGVNKSVTFVTFFPFFPVRIGFLFLASLCQHRGQMPLCKKKQKKHHQPNVGAEREKPLVLNPYWEISKRAPAFLCGVSLDFVNFFPLSSLAKTIFSCRPYSKTPSPSSTLPPFYSSSHHILSPSHSHQAY